MADELQVARAVADAALSAEGVYSLGTGALAEVATYGPGEKVLGVIVTEDTVEVHVVAFYPPRDSIPEFANELRDRLAPEAGNRSIEVVVEDLELTDAEVSEDADL